MAIKLSNLVKKQLPEFISTHYDSFTAFVEKYYESLEVHGQPLDILFNLSDYYDINYYSKNLLERGSKLSQPLGSNDDTIHVEDAAGFPSEYGYVKIGNEICFYTAKDGNNLTGVFRGVSGTTKLGDLYNVSKYQSSSKENHEAGAFVQNISNLFLFAIVKSFENQYLATIPKSYLGDTIDKRTLIKNITDFYKAKGSEKSIKFIFNSLVETSRGTETSIRKPSEEVMKASTSDWISDYVMTINVLSGDPQNLVGERIEQFEPYASAVVEKVEVLGDPTKAKLFLDKDSINNIFSVFGYTRLELPISSTDVKDFVIDVVSTKGWKSNNSRLYINNEEFFFQDKNINQFFIQKRSGSSNIAAGAFVYSRPPLNIKGVRFYVSGSVYNLTPKSKNPYSVVGDPILETNSAISSRNTIVYDLENAEYRWIANQNKERPSVFNNTALNERLSSVNANVSSIFEDETYFYICSSGYPEFTILGPGPDQKLENNKYLKLIRKNPQVNTEIYDVPRNDAAILLDGTLVYSKISETFVKYGPIEEIRVVNKGSGYKKPPVVLINNSPTKAKAVLSGDVVERIEVLTDQIYKKTPSIVITSGRNAVLTALVTSGKVTDLVITDPGEFYVAPPEIVIIDALGKGRLARYTARVSSSGRIIGVDKIDEGRNYSAANVIVQVIPRGQNAEAEVNIKKWYKNRFNEIERDDNNGGIVEKKFPILTGGKSYAVVGNPKKLRLLKNDNITNQLEENPTGHSKILGFAYDGNPIYGPYGFSDPLTFGSPIARMRSGYVQNPARIDGPPEEVYPLGTFDEDYTWVPNVESGKLYLDKNNGRFCVTPEYPNGIYAYFVTIDGSGEAEFPYIMGKSYYAIPVDSNYNSNITQNEIPRSVKIIDFSDYIPNGVGFSANIASIESGSIDSFFVDQTTRKHNPGNKIYFNESGTDGSGVQAEVGGVIGEDVEYLLAKKTTAVLTAEESVYLFQDYKFKQRNTGIYGVIVSDVTFDDTIVLEGLTGEFSEDDTYDLVDSITEQPVKILSFLLNKSGSFTAGSTVKLTDGKTKPDSVKATGVILESTANQNSLRVLVASGNFDLGIDSKVLSLQSSTLSDDVGIGIVTSRSLSEDISISTIDYNYAIAKTENPHGLVVGDVVDVFVNPDDTITEKKYYVRKKLFQELKLRDRKLNGRLQDTGVGAFTILSGGFYSAEGSFSATLGNADVNAIITKYLNFSSPTLNIVAPGTGYSVGNRLQVLGGSGTGLVVDINEVGPNGEILDISVNTPGKNYLQDQNVSPDQSPGNGAVIRLEYEEYFSLSDIEFIDRGSNFEEDNILQLENLVGVTQSRPAVIRVDHAGLSDTNDSMKLSTIENVAIDDYLKIDKEIVRVTGVDAPNKKVLIERGQKGTTAARHFNRAVVEFDNFVYTFTEGEYIPEIGTGASSPKVYHYNPDTNLLTLTYEYGINVSNTPNISISTFIRDESGPTRKEVKISSVGPKVFKLEFSEDDESNFVVNPDITAQIYYKYKFDTSHPSMVNTYLDFSPSLNYNLLTLEKVVGGVEPGTGSSDSFVDVKFGFGPRVSGNNYTNPADIRFSNYYYFITAGGVETERSKLQIIRDPLIGKKPVAFVTDTKFLYHITQQPQEQGTGLIQYITSSPKATGIIQSINITNKGVDYLKLPLVEGISVPELEASEWIPVMNDSGGVEEFKLVSQGQNYISAKVVLEGDGEPGTYKAIVVNGKVTNIIVFDPGRGYTKVPEVRLIETSNKIYPYSKNIGTPKSIKIYDPGSFYNQDETTIPKYTSTFVLLLSNVDYKNFSTGTRVEQYNSSNEVIFSGVVVESLREGSNILRLKDVVGEPDLRLPLFGAKIISVLFTDYEVEIRSYFDKLGYFNSEKGLISAAGSKITDSYYYQDYSYVIRSYTPIDIWRDLIKDVVHPAGFQLFGEVVVEAEVKQVSIPEKQELIPFSVTLNVGIQDAFTFSSKSQVTELVETIALADVQRGVGRVALDSEDLSSTSVKELILDQPFDGYIDSDTGLIFGKREFTLLDKRTNQPVFPYNECAVIISVNGIVQEPKVAYTINGAKIKFARAPLGPRIDEGQSLEGSTFTGKAFNFTQSSRNEQFFKKTNDIFQRSGIWLDSANQIRFNRNFIIEETFGYLSAKYPNLSFDKGKCRRDIGYIIDSFEHDLRFGGNSKTITSGKFYYNAANELDFINNELAETRDAYKYAAKLCAAAIRNWDVTFIDDPSTPDPQFEVTISADSDIITVPSTFGIVEGMYVSSGSQFPENTRVIEILDQYNVRVSSNSFSDITDEEVFVFNIPIGQVVLPPVGSTEVEFNYNGIIVQTDAELIVSDGVTVSITAKVAKLRQVRFALSRVNTGRFIDAANLILVNRQYMIDQTIEYINLTFPGFSYPSETKCRRDVGYLIDAVVYHLKYGGQNRLIDYAEKYFLANKLNYIKNELAETIIAFEYVFAMMIDAVEDPGAPYQTVNYSVAIDEENPLNRCAEVKAAIDTYKEIYTSILENGPNLIQRDFGNIQKSGAYTELKTVSNYNLIDDAELQLSTQINGIWFAAECANVISTLYTLHQSLDEILNNGPESVDVSIPDYINGESKVFDLYTDSNEIFKTESNEDLLVFVDGVYQSDRSYKIIRSEDPNVTDQIEFSEPLKWDQDDAQIRLQEGLNINTFHAFSIGNYSRRKIDSRFVGIQKGHTILDARGLSTDVITDQRYLTVFVDGVLQQRDKDYTIAGNRIIFDEVLRESVTSGVKQQSRVDMFTYTGGSNNNNFFAFNFQRNAYASIATAEFYYDLGTDDLYDTIKAWSNPSDDYPIILFNGDNPVGTISRLARISEPYPGVFAEIFTTNNPQLDPNLPLIFKKNLPGVPDLEFTFNIVFDEDTTLVGPETYVYGTIQVNDGVTLTVGEGAEVVSVNTVFDYKFDEDGDRIFERIVSPWMINYGFIKNNAWRITNKVSASILEGDKIKIDGESNFRTILSVPDKVRTTNYNPFAFASDNILGKIITSPSLEVPGGRGFSATAIIDPITGSVTGLEYGNVDSVRLNILGEPIPTLGEGYAPGIYIDFIPVDGNGGGAYGKVLTFRGSIVGAEIVEGGSGYTQPPICILTRGFDIIKSHRAVVADIQRNLNIELALPSTIYQQVTLTNPNLSEFGAYIVIGAADPIDEFVLNKILETPTLPVSLALPEQKKVEIVSLLQPQLFATSDQAKIVETLWTLPIDSGLAIGETTAAKAEASLVIQSTVGAGNTLSTPETINQIAALINSTFNIGEYVLFVTSTNGFPNEGLLQIGTEVVQYSSKAPDRFIITIRGAFGSVEQLHPVGTIVRQFLPFVSINRAPTQVIETENDIPAGAVEIQQNSEFVFRITSDNQVMAAVILGNADDISDSRINRNIEQIIEIDATIQTEILKIDSTFTFNEVPIGMTDGETNISILLEGEGGEVDVSTYPTSLSVIAQSTTAIGDIDDFTSELTIIPQASEDFVVMPSSILESNITILTETQPDIDVLVNTYEIFVGSIDTTLVSRTYVEVDSVAHGALDTTTEILIPIRTELQVVAINVEIISEATPLIEAAVADVDVVIVPLGNSLSVSRQITMFQETRLEDLENNNLIMPDGVNAPPSDITSVVENAVQVATINVETILEATSFVEEIVSDEDVTIIPLGSSISVTREIINIGQPNVAIIPDPTSYRQITSTLDMDEEIVTPADVTPEITTTYDGVGINAGASDDVTTDMMTTREGGTTDEFIEINPTDIEIN